MKSIYCCVWREDDCFCQNDMLSSIIEEDIEDERENVEGEKDGKVMNIFEWKFNLNYFWEFLKVVLKDN